MAKKKISYLCTAFRDGFQSVFGMRVLSKDYLPVVEQAVKAGMKNIEMGGGAAFQASFFYNNENAFDVMDKFHKICGPKVNLQTLARGVNVVALDSQSSAMIDLHAKLFKKHGVTTIRNFDALNDPNNLIYSAKCIKKAGLKHQLAIAMMSLPPGCSGAHTAEFYTKVLKNFIAHKIPFDSLCYKDASGTSVPATVYETISKARKIVGPKVPIEFHSHETAGVGLACYMAAIEAGADIVDLSLAPVSGGTCQPDVATMWHALRGTDYELDVDIDAIMKVEEALKDHLKEYFIGPEALHVEPQIPWSPMPGGALTANTQMLRDNGIMDKYAQIIKAMEEVVRKGGFGTSVTPVSQFYFQQAFNNVMVGPWKKIAEGYGKMVLGYFGKTPVPPDKKVVAIASEQLGLQPTTKTPLALNDANEKKSRSFYEKQVKEAGLPLTDENVFIVASCGQKGIDFLQGKGKIAVRYAEKKIEQKSESSVENLIVNGEKFEVKLQGNTVVVNGKEYTVETENTPQTQEQKTTTSSSENSKEISAGSVGLITNVFVKKGDSVKQGENLAVLEVMKMETFIKAPCAGEVAEIFVEKGAHVQAGQKLFALK